MTWIPISITYDIRLGWKWVALRPKYPKSEMTNCPTAELVLKMESWCYSSSDVWAQIRVHGFISEDPNTILIYVYAT